MINTQTKSSFRLTVSDFNQLFKQMVESDGVFSDLWIKGEICQLKPHHLMLNDILL